ncbi:MULTISPECIES: YuzF family protein [unclassified Psychrobacillus]|uniref:YuzF family protein n=1 Tax=unclassified Psychrobacillus TaxID=2636677 RepID=UPI00146EDC0C|nr:MULTISPECIES: YuzF family protein [unclassified Psychrobacillus]MCM3359127.1 YuzF family protein [Psychrobacillus sp. MER TA 171]NME07794.1 YuzF family protein [Psychrobacillus sp. BL-248-WT-3]
MNERSSVEFVSPFDGYVFQAAESLIGTNIAVQTTKNILQGKLTAVAPDHLVVNVGGVPFYVRIQAIVWISPNISK